MRTSSTISPGTVVLVELPAGKWRPAVVLQVYPEALWLIPGTGTERPAPEHITVAETSAIGKALKLAKPTHYYVGTDIVVPIASVRLPQSPGRAAPILLRMLGELVATGRGPAR